MPSVSFEKARIHASNSCSVLPTSPFSRKTHPVAPTNKMVRSHSVPVEMAKRESFGYIGSTLLDLSISDENNYGSKSASKCCQYRQIRQYIITKRWDIGIYILSYCIIGIALFFDYTLEGDALRNPLVGVLYMIPSLLLSIRLFLGKGSEQSTTRCYQLAYNFVLLGMILLSFSHFLSISSQDWPAALGWLLRFAAYIILLVAFLFDFSPYSRRSCPGWETPTVFAFVTAIIVGSFTISYLKIANPILTIPLILYGSVVGIMTCATAFRSGGDITLCIGTSCFVISDILWGANVLVLSSFLVAPLLAVPLQLLGEILLVVTFVHSEQDCCNALPIVRTLSANSGGT